MEQQDFQTLMKSRGFFYQSSSLYGGYNGVYDYGPLGVEVINNIKNRWWKQMVYMQEEIVGLDSGIIMDPIVWDASGHRKSFRDPRTTCSKTGESLRVDTLLEEAGVTLPPNPSEEEYNKLLTTHKEKLSLPEGCSVDTLSPVTFSSLLVESNIPSTREYPVYLRGETCQGIYVNFKNILESTRKKLPFGVAQIGKAFRNEISPRRFLFRTREFEQMEMQYFVKEEDASKEFEKWKNERLSFLYALGIKKESLRVTPHSQLIFYAKEAVDIEYHYPFGWGELEGIHNRGNYDLDAHSRASNTPLTYTEETLTQPITPFIIETSVGVGRLAYAVLLDAYTEEKLEGGDTRINLKLHPTIAPYDVAILPLSKKDELTAYAKEILHTLQPHYHCVYDATQSIGKRYRRQDEIGTYCCVTIDFDSLQDKCVTVRNRDTMQQERIPIDTLITYIQQQQISY